MGGELAMDAKQIAAKKAAEIARIERGKRLSSSSSPSSSKYEVDNAVTGEEKNNDKKEEEILEEGTHLANTTNEEVTIPMSLDASYSVQYESNRMSMPKSSTALSSSIANPSSLKLSYQSSYSFALPTQQASTSNVIIAKEKDRKENNVVMKKSFTYQSTNVYKVPMEKED